MFDNFDKLIEELNKLVEDQDMSSFKKIVKNMNHKIQKKSIVDKVLKKYRSKDFKRSEILKKARSKAHNPIANQKRSISMKLREIK